MSKESAMIITGGSSGIGRAKALAFGRHGAQVVIDNCNTSTGEGTVATIRSIGEHALFVLNRWNSNHGSALPDRHNHRDVWTP
ncbi:MAG: SDR family NAD(P)-dependent oxidoreductase [Roseiflexus sp.]|jgi:hypothetical protein|nr:SDR family NAD(P)-dependent oxidoreductase [Roseiflexus sp.]MBO9333757.1 SDR family NAD(P)-dependent oxidoreductase [Roseiflexus sp.]MBO9364064.1 SDR family NAD(P)-dependent oxidoreductase [Roseiflexus sp.]MBO9382290.1 SDR family NAD(P)-dependent oxidoreductase [Roseiflexus sp.]MBO9389455.1 SDR family NAD(P)-dependent oxidoreductase [Roseiflexus sp.]